jgi:hypothetical protein
LLPQTLGDLHVPQSIIVPHPSSAIPQSALTASHDLALQPQWLATPFPPQTLGIAQVPQCSV